MHFYQSSLFEGSYVCIFINFFFFFYSFKVKLLRVRVLHFELFGCFYYTHTQDMVLCIDSFILISLCHLIKIEIADIMVAILTLTLKKVYSTHSYFKDTYCYIEFFKNFLYTSRLSIIII
jgi:hypothetical protein